jgi:hypothetical protein
MIAGLLAPDSVSAVIASVRSLEPYMVTPPPATRVCVSPSTGDCSTADRGVVTEESRKQRLKVRSFRIIFHGRW